MRRGMGAAGLAQQRRRRQYAQQAGEQLEEERMKHFERQMKLFKDNLQGRCEFDDIRFTVRMSTYGWCCRICEKI